MVGTTGNPNSTTIIRLYGVFSIEMNSKERHEARYQRRKEKRLRLKQERNEQYGDFDKVFTFDNLYCAFKKCCRGVGWKASTQRYKANVLQIVKLSRGLNFLKRHFVLTDTGGVIIKPARKGITKMRHKLRTFKRWLIEGKMAIEDIRTSYISWKGHMKHCNAYRTMVNTDALYNKLFLEDGTQ